MSRLKIVGGEIFTLGNAIPNGHLPVEGDQLVELGREAERGPAAYDVFDASSVRLTPGLIDLHGQAAMGYDVTGLGGQT